MSAKKILKEIEHQARTDFLPIVGPHKGKLLEKIVKERKPKNILEIGSLIGYSSILMSQHLQKDSKIITIEINGNSAKIAEENIKKAGANKIIEVIHGDAMKIIPKLTRIFDFLFLDAQKDEYYNYILLAENKLSPNAIIVADNTKIFEKEMEDYLDYVRVNEHFMSESYDFGEDAMEVTFKQ